MISHWWNWAWAVHPWATYLIGLVLSAFVVGMVIPDRDLDAFPLVFLVLAWPLMWPLVGLILAGFLVLGALYGLACLGGLTSEWVGGWSWEWFLKMMRKPPESRVKGPFLEGR